MTVYRIVKSSGISFKSWDLKAIGAICANKARELGIYDQVLKVKEKQQNYWLNRVNDYPESFESVMQEVILGYFTAKLAA